MTTKGNKRKQGKLNQRKENNIINLPLFGSRK
jgi:hypothetical protein